MPGLRSWVRTLNLDDAHALIAAASPGIGKDKWTRRCMQSFNGGFSEQRQKEVVRIVRDHFLAWEADRLTPNAFLTLYTRAASQAQREMVSVTWALTHPITLIAAEDLVGIALKRGFEQLELEEVDRFCDRHLSTRSAESIRKTRTTLIGALEGAGCLIPRGTGRHRTLWPVRGNPDPATFTYLVLREMESRGERSMPTSHVLQDSIAARLTQCGPAHADRCVKWATRSKLLSKSNNMVRATH